MNLARLWLSEGYFVGFGRFFLMKTSKKERPAEVGEVWHFLAAWLGLALLWWILAIRGDEASVLIPLILGIAGLSLFAHEIAHTLTARLFGLQTTFKAWDTGLVFSSLLAAVFGLFLPAYGSTYMQPADWRYDAKRKETGYTYVAGPTISLAHAIAFWFVMSFASNELLVATARLGYTTNLIFVILNLLPIEVAGGLSAWDGRKIYTWSKIIWSLLATGAALLIVADILF